MSDSSGHTVFENHNMAPNQSIPIVVNWHFDSISNPPSWFEPHYPRNKMVPIRKTVYRNNKVLDSQFLPTISVSNMRSLFPKIKNFKNDFLEREIGLALLSEVWEKKGKKKHKFEAEKMLQKDGLKYISTPRPPSKRGGGSAIVANLSLFTLEKVDVINPRSVEVTYGLLRAKNATAKFKEIIAVAFYSHHCSRKKSELLDHMITTCHVLMTKYPKAVVVIGGDRNEMSISPLLDSIPKLRQIVTKNTCNGKVLDVLLLSIPEHYPTPLIIPPVPADDPASGCPSDHDTVIATPLSNTGLNLNTNEYTTKISRPLPDSGITEFGQWITQQDWRCIKPTDQPDQQVTALQETLTLNLKRIFPTKEAKFSIKDKPYINADIKKLDRLKKREYRKHGKSKKWLELHAKFELKLEKAALDHLNKNVRSLKESDPGKAYTTLKKMGAQPGDMLDEGSFTLLNHLEANLTNKEAVDKIAAHFAEISQEYPPINADNLPQRVKDKLSSKLQEIIPKLDEIEVYQQIIKAKKPKSGVPGDLPRRLVQEFAPELATPITQIYNNIISTGNWPRSWKVEFGIPLQKVENPKNEDELRIISLTSFFSKVFEKFVMDWLLEHIGHHIDRAQYGGLKGNSVAHYLIDLINFVKYNQDLKDIRAVLAVAKDFSKVFNRQNHNILIRLLSDLGVLGWLLSIVIGFLENRELEVSYKGEVSGRKLLPGGGPQGTILGMFLFLILINEAGFRDNLNNVGKYITKPFNKREPMPRVHLKYIDDMTVAESINLKNKLVVNPDPNPTRPLQYHERTGHVLPEDQSDVQTLLNELSSYTETNEMKLNTNKSKVILFNNGRKYDFMPKCHFDNGDILDVVEEIKLLGVKIRSDLSWSTQCDYMCQRGFARLWMLRRLKPFGTTTDELLEVYRTQIRCIMEFAVAVWNAGLTKNQVKQLERVQKCAFAIILGPEYIDYTNALKILNMKTLSERRHDLCYKFAQKSLNHYKHSNWFCPNESVTVNTRSTKPNLKPVEARLRRFEKSPLYYLTELLSDKCK